MSEQIYTIKESTLKNMVNTIKEINGIDDLEITLFDTLEQIKILNKIKQNSFDLLKGETVLYIPANIEEIYSNSVSSTIQKIEWGTNPKKEFPIILYDNAFNNSSITEITLPENITKMGKGIFGDNQLTSTEKKENLNKVQWNCAPTLYNSDNTICLIPDYTFNYQTKLRSIFFGEKAKNYIKEIGQFAFRHCWGLEEIDLKSLKNLQTIKRGAFLSSGIPVEIINEENVKILRLPERLITIEGQAFQDTNIDLVDFGTSPKITAIGDYAFSYGKGNLDFTLPETINILGKAAFSHNNNIKNFLIKSEHITEIPEETFLYSNIEYIVIPSWINKIYQKAFYNTEIGSIIFQSDNNLVLGVQSFCWSKIKEDIYLNNANEISIDKEAFLHANINNLTIDPVSIKSIKADAFLNATINKLIIEVNTDTQFLTNWSQVNLENKNSSPFLAVDSIVETTGGYFMDFGSEDIIIKPWTFCGFYYNPDIYSIEGCITLETSSIIKIQQEAFSKASLDNIQLDKIQIIEEKAFANANIYSQSGSGENWLTLGSEDFPVKSIASDAFLDVVSREEINRLILQVYYDNRDYSTTGFPEDYNYSEYIITDSDGIETIIYAPDGADELWGFSGVLAEKIQLVWRKAFEEA